MISVHFNFLNLGNYEYLISGIIVDSFFTASSTYFLKKLNRVKELKPIWLEIHCPI
jgi:hypothetical protein